MNQLARTRSASQRTAKRSQTLNLALRSRQSALDAALGSPGQEAGGKSERRRAPSVRSGSMPGVRKYQSEPSGQMESQSSKKFETSGQTDRLRARDIFSIVADSPSTAAPASAVRSPPSLDLMGSSYDYRRSPSQGVESPTRSALRSPRRTGGLTKELQIEEKTTFIEPDAGGGASFADAITAMNGTTGLRISSPAERPPVAQPPPSPSGTKARAEAYAAVGIAQVLAPAAPSSTPRAGAPTTPRGGAPTTPRGVSSSPLVSTTPRGGTAGPATPRGSPPATGSPNTTSLAVAGAGVQTTPRGAVPRDLTSRGATTPRVTTPRRRETAMRTGHWSRWQKMVDDKVLGAHWEPLFPELPASVALENDDQKHVDSIFAETLYKRHPEDPVSPLAGEPLPASFAAFTDRAFRIREGRHMRAALVHKDDEGQGWTGHLNCRCAVCQPHCQRAAGAASHEFSTKKVGRAGHDGFVSPRSPEEFTSLNHHDDSSRVNTCLNQNEPLVEDELDHAEACFGSNMGRKARSPARPSSASGLMLPHRILAWDDSVAAGQYDHERYNFMPDTRIKHRQTWQGRSGDEPTRSGVALVLSPRPSDPPPPVSIIAGRKADGLYKYGVSEQSAHLAAGRNQEMFRFGDPSAPRSRSLPPCKIDPREYAGQPTGAPLLQTQGTCNPLNMDAKGDGGHAAFGNHIKTVGPSGNIIEVALGDYRSFRKGYGNNSSTMSFAMNQELMNESFDMERSWRMRHDPSFAQLCEAASQSLRASQRQAEANKGVNGHSTSDHIKAQLVWVE